jgi:hypothetical protein
MPAGVCPFAEQMPRQDLLIHNKQDFQDRVGFCDHAAGGFYNTMRRVTFWNDPNGNGNTDDAVSVHFAIGRNAGEITQVANIFHTVAAQGRLGPVIRWAPFAEMGRQNPNGYLISIEHADWVSVNGVSKAVPGSQWTPEEYENDLRVKRWCIEEVKRVTGKNLMRFGIDSLAGHHMFDTVNRPECPGRFWRDEYQAQLWADLQEKEEDLGVANPAWGTWKDRPPTVPYRSYLLFATPDGLKKRLVASAQEHEALHFSGIFEADGLVEMRLQDLKAFVGSPEPDAP